MSFRGFALTLGTLLAGLTAACNSSGGAKSPRISTIPLQSAQGGTTFALDLSSFVEDDTATAAYSVVSGGGSFTGSTYSQAFPRLATYEVVFKVVDFRGNSNQASFKVKVTTAEIGVVEVGQGVSLFDAQTNDYTDVLIDDGLTKQLRTTLKDGSLLFEYTYLAQTDLHLYNIGDNDRVAVATDVTKDEKYVGKTSKDLIVFVRGAAPNRSLHLFNPVTEGTLPITVGATKDGSPDERDALVTGDDHIYFESAPPGGGGNIYYYDLAGAKVVPVSTNAADEDLLAVTPDNGIVYRRASGSSGYRLYYYSPARGNLEVGNGLGAAYDGENRIYGGVTGDSRVVFETQDSGGDLDVHIWNPTDNSTATIAASTSNETFAGVTGTNRVVYTVEVSATDHDLYVYDPGNGNSTELDSNAELETLNATLANGDIIFSTESGGDFDLYHWSQSGGSASAIAATTTSEVFDKLLSDDNVVYTVGGQVHHYNTATSTDTDIATGTGTEAFAGEASGGQFVIKLTVTGPQDDLYLFTGTSTATAITTDAAHEVFQAGTESGKVLYTRTNTTTSLTDLYVYTITGGSTAQVGTTNGKNESVLSVVNAVDEN